MLSPSLRRPADWLPRAVVAGFSATMVLLTVHLAGYAVLWAFDRIAPTTTISHRTMAAWFHALTYNRLTDPASSELYTAIVLQIVLGMGGGVLYALLIEPRFREAEWLRGLVFGFVTWAGTLVILLPALGAGLFGAALGAGPLPIYATLLAHLAYGVVLGLVYSASDDIFETDEVQPRSRAGLTAGWRRSALGATAGAVIGAAIGLGVGLLVPWHGLVFPAGIMPLALALGSALAGAGLGELVGSLSALPSKPGRIVEA